MPVAPEAVVEAGQHGLNIAGFHHAIDGSAIRHTFKNHGNVKTEAARGQEAVIDADFSMIPDILVGLDKTIYGLTNKIGRDLIVYLKTMPDGTTAYLKEVRTGRKTLSMQSMRMYPRTTNATSIMKSLRPTSETLPGDTTISIVENPQVRHLQAGDGLMGNVRASASWTPGKLVPPEQQLSEQRLLELVDTALSGLDNAPPAFVLAGAHLLADQVAQAAGVPVSAGGMQGGKIFLFRNGIPNAASALATVWHELFHYGLRKLMTPEAYASNMLRLYNNDATVRKYANNWKTTEDAGLRQKAGASSTDMHLLSIEEGLAFLAEDLKATAQHGTRISNTTLRAIIEWMADTADRMGLAQIGGALRSLTHSDGERFIGSIFQRIHSGELGREQTLSDLSPRSINYRTDSAGKAIKSVTATSVKRAGNSLADYRGLALQGLGRRQLLELYEKDIPSLAPYNDLVQKMDKDKNEAGAGADAIADAWGELKDERALAELMHDATLAQEIPESAWLSVAVILQRIGTLEKGSGRGTTTDTAPDFKQG